MSKLRRESSLCFSYVGALSALLSRAGGGLLDLRLSDFAFGWVEDCVSESSGGCAAGGGDDCAATQALNADKGLSATTLSEDDGRKALATGKILLLAVQAAGGVTFEYDDTNPDARTARLIADRALEKAAGQQENVQITSQLVHEAGARYIDFVIPGLLGMNLMSSAIWGLGFSIVEARQKKLLKRLVASPMPRWQYLASFLLSRLLLLVIEVGVFLGFARLVFGVPFRGPIWQLALMCVLASLSFSALGLLIASRAKTMEAASGLMNLVMLPMWILSGVFFSASRFPNVLQPFIRALPLTAAIDALRGNMLQGSRWSICWRRLPF